MLSQFGIDVDRPLMCQVSRFDPWKDPLGVIDAYRLVKEQMPEVQLALVGSMASDDPEGWDFFNATVAHADGDADIHILNNFNNVGAIEVNAFQSHADVLIQKSTREGFGLTVSEAIWKARPFIGGDVGGIPLQIEDGVTGFLVSSAEQCAERALEILARPRARARARPARQGARAPHFLTPRYLRDYLRIFTELDADVSSGAGTATRRWCWSATAGRSRSSADGEIQRGSGGLVTALTGLASHREAIWIASAMNEYDARGLARATAARVPGPLARRAASTRCAWSSATRDAYDRFYNVFANPMLWFIQHYLWDLSNAPDIRREEIEAFEFGYNVVNEDLARGRRRADRGLQRTGRDGPRLPPLHAARTWSAEPARTSSCTTSSTSRGPSRTPGGCCRADPRGDLHGPARERHHRLPHALLPPATSCSAATT